MFCSSAYPGKLFITSVFIINKLRMEQLYCLRNPVCCLEMHRSRWCIVCVYTAGLNVWTHEVRPNSCSGSIHMQLYTVGCVRHRGSGLVRSRLSAAKHVRVYMPILKISTAYSIHRVFKVQKSRMSWSITWARFVHKSRPKTMTGVRHAWHLTSMSPTFPEFRHFEAVLCGYYTYISWWSAMIG